MFDSVYAIYSHSFFHHGSQILYALLCGGLIGLERELKNKAAGIKTNMLICLGAALYTSASVMITSEAGGDAQADPSRIAAQIVSGIGFLGGGTIIQSRGAITGLTTAATIWVVAAIGVCIGIGGLELAIAWTFAVLLVLVLTSIFEDRILGRTLTFTCIVVFTDPSSESRLSVNQALTQNDLTLGDFNISSHLGL